MQNHQIVASADSLIDWFAHKTVTHARAHTPTHTLEWGGGELPSSGLSEVIGMVLDTMFKNTVNDSRMVTPERCIGIHMQFSDWVKENTVLRMLLRMLLRMSVLLNSLQHCCRVPASFSQAHSNWKVAVVGLSKNVGSYMI